jgi:hypothetical protein
MDALEQEHDRKIVPLVVASGIELDMDREEDLGHPERPWLWEELHGNCPVGTLQCATCGWPLYLRERRYPGYTRRIVSLYRHGERLDPGAPESDEHKAFKARIAHVAEREGFDAVIEARAQDSLRITDVVVVGDSASVGWEVQLSPISSRSVADRRDLAVRDRLVPSWICTRKSVKAVANRVPYGRVHEHTAREISNVLDLRVQSGYRRIGLDRCNGQHRSGSWHRGRRCEGWHGRPLPMDPEEQPSFDDLVRKTATGDIVAVHWPRPTQFAKEFWLWTPKTDANDFWDIELDAAPVAAIQVLPTDDAPAIGLTRTHTAPILTNPDGFPHETLAPGARARPTIHGISAVGGHLGLAPHQRCPSGNPADPRPDGRTRACPECEAKPGFDPRTHGLDRSQSASKGPVMTASQAPNDSNAQPSRLSNS